MGWGRLRHGQNRDVVEATTLQMLILHVARGFGASTPESKSHKLSKEPPKRNLKLNPKSKDPVRILPDVTMTDTSKHGRRTSTTYVHLASKGDRQVLRISSLLEKRIMWSLEGATRPNDIGGPDVLLNISPATLRIAVAFAFLQL